MTTATEFEPVDVVTSEARYGCLAYFRDDDPIGASLRLYGEWAQLELDFLLRFVRAGDTVVDVGANVGTHTVAFARAAGAAGRVIAFEPQARVFDLLERNVRSNGYHNVALHRVALGAEHSVRHVPSLDYAAHVNVGAVALLARPAEASSAVDLVPLDSFALDAVRLIKIDVEGMECEVLRGAAQTLQRCRPLLSVECNTVEAGAAVLAALRDADYAFYVNRTLAFNPANYRANAMNRFGTNFESSIFCVPRELHDAVAEICAEQRTLSPVSTVDDVARVFLGGSRPEEADELTRLRYRVAKHGFELAEAERRAAGDADRIRELALNERAAADGRAAEGEARLAQADAQLAGARADAADAQARLADAEFRTASAETHAEAERMRAEHVERRAELVKTCLAEAQIAALAAEQRAVQAERIAAQAQEDAAQSRERTAQAERCSAQGQEQIRERDVLIASLVTSRSWRITRPLRLLRHVFGPRDGADPGPGAPG